MSDAPREAWLRAHPYLEPLERIERALEASAAASPPPVTGSDAGGDGEGFPILQRPSAGRIAGRAAPILARMVTHLAASQGAPASVSGPCRELAAELARSPGAVAGIIRWLLGSGEPPPHRELLYTLGWLALSRAIAPAAAGLAGGYAPRAGAGGGETAQCPSCGAAPVMAQLVSSGDGRRRLLACGRCRTRWEHRRIGCPLCGNGDQAKLLVLQVEGDDRLRLDVCESCHGYLKTYEGEGEEDLFLLDWPTLHLDLLAAERGYRRGAASLFEG